MRGRTEAWEASTFMRDASQVTSRDRFRVIGSAQPAMRYLGLDGEQLFVDPRIRVWRRLDDRENCTLDFDIDGTRGRWHIKRFPAPRGAAIALEQARAHELLLAEQIPTATMIGHAALADGRGAIIFEDLKDHAPADKLLARGEVTFEQIQATTADLAARLHGRGVHHRDLYLCHFMINPASGDVRLIDTARVRRLGNFLTRQRWIIKDLAQFWYSTLSLPITDAQREAWLARYASTRGLPSPAVLRAPILRKVKRIARHDKRINVRTPDRHVSLEGRQGKGT